ncbi:zinc-binding dehydrogenase [Kitasatospora sp. NPDC049258]|uniref:zinc-binding dehydrogenase n=1 Tax=Kitasatospora sp. NPDC049258 TaxID=3155394 RepID=UPI003436C464
MTVVTQDRLGGPGVLHLAERDRPVPGATEVLVRVRAAGVNPTDFKARTAGGLLRAEPPFVLGHDVSGVVEAVGWGVTLVEPDRAALLAVADLVATGRLRAEVSTVLPLAEAAKAHELVESGRTLGKVVLDLADRAEPVRG